MTVIFIRQFRKDSDFNKHIFSKAIPGTEMQTVVIRITRTVDSSELTQNFCQEMLRIGHNIRE